VAVRVGVVDEGTRHLVASGLTQGAGDKLRSQGRPADADGEQLRELAAFLRLDRAGVNVGLGTNASGSIAASFSTCASRGPASAAVTGTQPLTGEQTSSARHCVASGVSRHTPSAQRGTTQSTAEVQSESLSQSSGVHVSLSSQSGGTQTPSRHSVAVGAPGDGHAISMQLRVMITPKIVSRWMRRWMRRATISRPSSRSETSTARSVPAGGVRSPYSTAARRWAAHDRLAVCQPTA